MKDSTSLRLKCLTASLLLFIYSLSAVHAQQSVASIDAGAEKAQVEAIGMMKKGNWKAADQMFQQIITEWANDVYYQQFPPFGTVYYNHGVCQLKLKQFAEAADSFSICHEKFPNKFDEGTGVGGQ